MPNTISHSQHCCYLIHLVNEHLKRDYGNIRLLLKKKKRNEQTLMTKLRIISGNNC